MIKFSLACSCGTQFEGWFRNAEACAQQLEANKIACPSCRGHKVAKALQKPFVSKANGKSRGRLAQNKPVETDYLKSGVDVGSDASSKGPKAVNRKSNQVARPNPQMSHADTMKAFAKFYEVAKEVRAHIEKTCDNVGKDFAEKARQMHYGETEARGIYGEVSKQDAQDLKDEGIEVAPLPVLPKIDA